MAGGAMGGMPHGAMPRGGTPVGLRGGTGRRSGHGCRPVPGPPGLRSRLVADLRPGAGPLGGIEAGLAVARHATLVAVACDMPYVTPELTQRLVGAAEGHDAAVPRLGGLLEPACAAYRRSAAAPISAALAAGNRKAADALSRLEVAWLDGEDPSLFTNLNTPAEYHAFLAGLRKTR